MPKPKRTTVSIMAIIDSVVGWLSWESRSRNDDSLVLLYLTLPTDNGWTLDEGDGGGNFRYHLSHFVFMSCCWRVHRTIQSTYLELFWGDNSCSGSGGRFIPHGTAWLRPSVLGGGGGGKGKSWMLGGLDIRGNGEGGGGGVGLRALAVLRGEPGGEGNLGFEWRIDDDRE